MKALQVVEVITDAVSDAVRELLPRLIAEHLEARLAATVTPALALVERAQSTVHERITDMQTDFAVRCAAQSDALTNSWQRQLDGLRGIIAEQLEARLGATITPALDTLRRDVERLGPHLLDASALDETRRDFETRLGALRTDMRVIEAHTGEQIGSAVREALDKAVAAMPASPGPPGPPGRAGRDAVFTPPVLYKAGSLYTHGALVQHRGGVWHANVDTDAEPGEPCAGWGLVLDGCEPLRVEAWGEAGELALVYRYASGTVKHIALGFRPMQHVGIYDHGRAYLVNDCVTCDGSVWLARSMSCEVKPGTDEGARAWQLIVKRGKDGREGAPGPRGEPGPQGTPAPAPRSRKINGAAP
jgi:hypothetical protein